MNWTCHFSDEMAMGWEIDAKLNCEPSPFAINTMPTMQSLNSVIIQELASNLRKVLSWSRSAIQTQFSSVLGYLVKYRKLGK